MAKGKKKHEWEMTDILACISFNHPFRKARVKFGDFNPMESRERRRDFIPVDASIMGAYFPKCN